MSAYICDKRHILYLVSAAMSRAMGRGHSSFTWGVRDESGQWSHSEQLGAGDYERAAEVANLLWQENIKSVSARYPNESSATLPGPIGEVFEVESRDFSCWTAAPDPVQVLKACACYAYQSCEHEGWENSEAHSFIKSLEKHAICALPGYEDAAWGAPEKTRQTFAWATT